jgi:hypothetical protein
VVVRGRETQKRDRVPHLKTAAGLGQHVAAGDQWQDEAVRRPGAAEHGDQSVQTREEDEDCGGSAHRELPFDCVGGGVPAGPW